MKRKTYVQRALDSGATLNDACEAFQHNARTERDRRRRVKLERYYRKLARACVDRGDQV
jgi:hypothetical protein